MARKRSQAPAPADTDALALPATPAAIAVASELAKTAWFAKLSDGEKTTITTEGQGLAAALQTYGRSRIGVAAHLTKIQEVLGPLKLFEKFLKTFHFKRRSAYRAIKEYQNVLSTGLAKPIIDVAMARNVNIMGESTERPFGIYTAAVKKLPPPPKPTEQEAATYLDELDRVRKGLPRLGKPTPTEPEYLGPSDPKDLMKEAYRFVMVRYGRLPSGMTATKRLGWLKTLSGMLMREAGVSGEQSVAVIAPPEDFKAVRGRPRIH